MKFCRAILTLLLVWSVAPVLAAQDEQNNQAQATFGQKIAGVGSSVLETVYEHPYLTALGLWCAFYHRTACEKLVSMGNHSWIFVPVVGSILIYLLHNQSESAPENTENN